MAATTGKGWPLPEGTTSPPDVVKWLTDGLNAADGSVLWGPAADVPASLPPGTIYLGY